jgi:hypothetical protein
MGGRLHSVVLERFPCRTPTHQSPQIRPRIIKQKPKPLIPLANSRYPQFPSPAPKIHNSTFDFILTPTLNSPHLAKLQALKMTGFSVWNRADKTARNFLGFGGRSGCGGFGQITHPICKSKTQQEVRVCI